MEAKRLLIDDGPCTYTHEGKDYTSGGAWLTDLGGMVYTHDCANGHRIIHGFVSDWHGKIKIPAVFGDIWISNMGDRRRSVRFVYEDISFYGMCCSIDWQECVNVRPTKR